MGRLVGLDYFFSQEALTEEKANASEIRRARGLASDDDGDGGGAKDLQRIIVRRMQHQFNGRILR